MEQPLPAYEASFSEILNWLDVYFRPVRHHGGADPAGEAGELAEGR
jgi:hypothetical protein